MMTGLIIAAAVAVWLLFQIASRLDKIHGALLANASKQRVPEREPVGAAESAKDADIPAPDSWLQPFAFSLDELATQRAYVEVLTERGLASIRTDPPGSDSDAIAAEFQEAQRICAAMIQANQRVRNGTVLVTEARREVFGDRLPLLPLGGEPRPDFAYRYKRDAIDNVSEAVIRRFLREGAIVWQREDARAERSSEDQT